VNWFRGLLTLFRRPAPPQEGPPTQDSGQDTGGQTPEGSNTRVGGTWIDRDTQSGTVKSQSTRVIHQPNAANQTGNMIAPAPVRPGNHDDTPETIGPYRVVKLLGEGGMGRVYLVEFGEPNEEGDVQKYALKTLNPVDAGDIEFYERFKREISIGLKLQHPNVCRMVDWGMGDHEAPYLVMELLEGEMLNNVILAAAPIPMVRAKPIVMQILAGLDAIHGTGVVHRDLKPANVFLLMNGQVKLMDFGIARKEGARNLTVTGAALGTPEFVAPEQVLDTKRVDGRADLFNVGLILYQMLTGHLPFESNSIDGTLLRLVKGDQTPITDFRGDLPPEVADWIQKMLSKKPADRFQPAVEAARAITF
jgi:serine/threonine-protein kinase